jgi:hypothetical protein
MHHGAWPHTLAICKMWWQGVQKARARASSRGSYSGGRDCLMQSALTWGPPTGSFPTVCLSCCVLPCNLRKKKRGVQLLSQFIPHPLPRLRGGLVNCPEETCVQHRLGSLGSLFSVMVNVREQCAHAYSADRPVACQPIDYFQSFHWGFSSRQGMRACERQVYAACPSF